MPVCNKRSIQLLPKRIVLNPKDGKAVYNDVFHGKIVERESVKTL